MSRHSFSTRHGFTLIDLAIMITVIAMLASAFLSSQKVAREDSNVSDVNAKLSRIQDAIQFFYQNNAYLPCPAANNASISSASTYRVSADCTATLTTSTDPTAGYDATPIGPAPAGTYVRIGAVPTRSLGLADSDGVDKWGGTIRYAVIRQLAVNAATYTTWTGNTTANSIIHVLDGNLADRASNASGGVIAYVLFSGGPESQGIYSASGTLINSCAATNYDAYNCTNNASWGKIAKFYDGPINETAGSTYYYNIVRWKLLSDLGR